MNSLEKKSRPSFIIQGLAGRKTLKGTVRINGAKNSALKAMAAAILFDGIVTLDNIPDNADIQTMTEVLRRLGARVEKLTNSRLALDDVPRGMSLSIDSTSIFSTDVDTDLASGMRASVVLTGPLLARYGKVSFPAPGGCVIGARPIDLFLSAYEMLGAKIDEVDHVYKISDGRLSAGDITFKKMSVGATETLMMTAVLLNGKTILKNCAMEPEIVNVAEWLNVCGAKIIGAGTSTITIYGTNGKLLSPVTPFVTIPDRIEAGSFLILAALTAENLVIEDCEPKHLESLTKGLIDSGVHIEISKTSMRVINDTNRPAFKAFDIETREYPGFPTDIQAPVVVFLTQSEGVSVIKETIFEGRFKYIEDLILMGAKIEMTNSSQIVVNGPCILREPADDTELTAHDIRAGFAIVIAALVGHGEFMVNNVHLIDRGYERLEERLRKLGADIERI